MPPRRQWIDKKRGIKYQLFHRPQNDPLIHDPEADDRVLYQVSGPEAASCTTSSSQHASGDLINLKKEFRSEDIRENEGEAANYGIFFDDSKYDYMQHLQELGTGGGNSHFVEAALTKGKGKGKGPKLEDSLKDFSLDDSRSELAGGSVCGRLEDASTYAASTTSSYVRRPTYQDQQDIPDAIAGFQPDMDPRLREALEALDDNAYVDQEDEDDLFGKLTKSAEEIEPGEWEDTLLGEGSDDGWESDTTEKAPPGRQTQDPESSDDKAAEEPSLQAQRRDSAGLPDHSQPVPDTKPEAGEWLREFTKYKKDVKAMKPTVVTAVAADEDTSERLTEASTLLTIGGTPIRRKRRKGALTSPSTYSMTSSSLARTEGLRLLDNRFEKIEALYALDEVQDGDGNEYNDDDGTLSMVSGMTGTSQAPSLVSRRNGHSSSGDLIPPRSDFDDVMDSFLAGWQDRSAQSKRKGAKGKRGKNGNEALGMRMLDEIRQGLGPARVTT